jgi:hypothetical protein
MDKALENKLIECLNALDEGQPLERVLGRYPEDVDRLRPLLETAVQLADFKLNPSLAAQKQSRDALLSQAAALSTDSRSPRASLFLLRRLLLPLSAFVVLLLLGAGLFSASASAIPGETLYGTKLLFEDIQLSLTADQGARDALREQFMQERIREIRSLLDTGLEAEVEFEGVIGSMASETWIIAQLDVSVTDDTRIFGVPEVGDMARVNGRVLSGTLDAGSIVMLTDDRPPISSTPTHSPTPTVTTVLEPSPTPEDTDSTPQAPSESTSPVPPDTSGPDPSETPLATATPEPTSTSTSSPTPTATMTPDGDDDGVSVDNSNENGDDDNSNDDDGGENENDKDRSGSGDGNENSNEDGNENDNENENENENENSNDND